MKRILLIIAFCLVSFSLLANQGALALRRFALFIGSNDGGRDRITLRYAESDAQAMAALMHELGGIAPEDRLVLLGPKRKDLNRGFNFIKGRIDASRQKARRVEFLIYYSGHSDESGLLLGTEHLAYVDLRNAMGDIQADVKIAILDSCSSGAFTRLKGGIRQLPLLLDESVQMKGHAYLTSSSADEAAQESDRINASFFTHYLISGLRGAADVTRDGQITLNEAYHYAFSETLARTENTQGGPQHPSYNIKLSGTGDLTLTDLRSTSSGIIILEDIQGRLYIRDSRGNLMVELQKLPGIPVTLALPAGRYTITLYQDGSLYEASLVLKKGRREKISLAGFSPRQRETTRFQGPTEQAEAEELIFVPLNIAFLPFLQSLAGPGIVHNFSLNILIGRAYAIHGCEIGSILNLISEDVVGAQIAGVGNILGGDITGAQEAGVFNLVDGDSTSFQAAGVFNMVRGRASFFQTAGVFNITGSSFSGMQTAGVFNKSKGRVAGAQIAGVFNMTGESFAGLQTAGLFNKSGLISGAQIGLVNIASSVRGTQIGLVNIASGEVKGVQIGLVNIARRIHGIPAGLINISEDGFHLSSWITDIGTAYLGLQSGNRYLYSLLYGGFKTAYPLDLFTAGLGLGFHVPLGPFYISADLSVKYVFQASAGQSDYWSIIFPSIRTIAGINIFGNLSLFGGVLLEGYIPGLGRETDLHAGYPFDLQVWHMNLLFYSKLFIGLQI